MSYRYVRVASFYPSMFADFIQKCPQHEALSYEDIKDRFFFQAYGLSNFYETQLALLGNITDTIVPSFDLMQEKWRAVHGFRGLTRFATVLEQLVALQPEVLYIEDIFFFSEIELDQIRSKVKSLRLVYGFLGSAYAESTLRRMRKYDFIVTCTNELADEFRAAGIDDERTDISFFGALTSGEQFHNGRNEILQYLVTHGVDIKLFSEVTQGTDHLRIPIQAVAKAVGAISRLGYFSALEDLSIVRKVRGWVPRESMVVDRRVQERIRRPLFGLDMYKALSTSTVTFNSHIKRSRLARNMRLFEATGVGTCLLTDWRENMADMFEDGKEVVNYRSAEDCLAKVQWLVQNPDEAGRIGAAGQRKCLEEHTYKNRASRLDQIIGDRLSS